MYLTAARTPPVSQRSGHCKVAPEIAVEVVSPDDNFKDVNEKVEEYLAAGVRLVWVVIVRGQLVHVHRNNETVAKVRADHHVSGEDVLPDFQCRVAEFIADPLAGPQS
jgi:Uma2 family endonuclease